MQTATIAVHWKNKNPLVTHWSSFFLRQFSASAASPGHGFDDVQLRVLDLCLTSHRSEHSDQSDHSVHLQTGSLSSVKAIGKILLNWLTRGKRI